MVVAAATIAHDYIGIGLSGTGEDALRWCAVVYTALPIAFLVGVLRTHIRRTILSRLLADLTSGTAYEDVALEEAAAAARRALRNKEPLPRLEQLTPRELEVLALIAEGRTDRGIAKELFVTPKTVEAHVRSIFRKLDLPREETENRRVHAVLTFLRRPLVLTTGSRAAAQATSRDHAAVGSAGKPRTRPSGPGSRNGS